MFRVSKAEEPSGTIVTIDGQLSGDTIAVVETCCDQALSTGKTVHLFLRDVSMVDHPGRVLLSRLAQRYGAIELGCGSPVNADGHVPTR